MKISIRLAAAIILLTSIAYPCAAQERDHRRGYERERSAGWHGDIHRFHEFDLPLWRSGRWFHGPYNGRTGWWWIADGTWYFYPAPVYPYPDPYLPPGVAFPAAPAQNAPQQFWYYCNNPAGYYPYVVQCRSTWRALPAPNTSQVVAPAPMQTAPATSNPQSAPVAAAPAGGDWYYCTNPAGYYPSVPECKVGWQRVPANAPPGATAK